MTAQPVTLLRDRSMVVAPGEIVVTRWIDIELCVFGCRDPMSIGDVGDKHREHLQLGEAAAWPPPRGHWHAGRFVIDDGRHSYVAQLMLGRTFIFVAWLTSAVQSRPTEDGA